jgi:hypothetical protein
MKLFQIVTTLSLALSVFFFHGYRAHAEGVPVVPTISEVEVTSGEIAPTEAEKSLLTLKQELISLKSIEKDPETGSVMKFLLRFKIRQLENQLNIKKALQ